MKKELVKKLTEANFEDFISDKKQKLAIIDFFAEWCGPCVMMAPVIEKMAEKNPNVKFGKVDVDEANNLANQFEISSIPCIVFFKDGAEVDRVIGGIGEQILAEKIKDYLKY